MKIGKITLVLTCCGMAFQTGMAQELPKWANKARKAVFSVITYNKENQILNTGNGFYIDENGTAVSDYTLFKGAERAVVVTADGKVTSGGIHSGSQRYVRRSEVQDSSR